MATMHHKEDTGMSFEQIGQRLFGRYVWQLSKRFSNCGMQDEFAYESRFEEYFKEAFVSGWAVGKTCETLFFLERCGIVPSLDSWRKEFDY